LSSGRWALELFPQVGDWWKVAKGKLHTLDFTRIKDATRDSARKLLTDESTGLPNALAQELSIPSTSNISGATISASTKAAATGTAGVPLGKGGKGRLMTPEEKKRVVEALVNATTTEEVRKLERMLAEGLVPEGGINGVWTRHRRE
jgi:U2 small nuclear ribonucleoprotein A'